MQKFSFEMRNICVITILLSLLVLMALLLTYLYLFVFHANYSSGDITIDTCHEFENDLLNKLNHIRVMHSVPPLTLDDELTLAASDWAIHIHKKAIKDGVLRSRFFHPINKGVCVYIEANSTMPKNVSGHLHAAVVSWYCEITRFNFSSKMYSDNTAQFTQLIWKDTERVGFSRVVNLVNGDVAIVARFAPVGNSLSLEDFGRNVYEPVRGNTKIYSCTVNHFWAYRKKNMFIINYGCKILDQVLPECPIKRDTEPAITTQTIWTTTEGVTEPMLATTEEPEPTTTPNPTTTKPPKIRKPKTKPPVIYKNLTAFRFDDDDDEETGNRENRHKTMHSLSVSGHRKELKKVKQPNSKA